MADIIQAVLFSFAALFPVMVSVMQGYSETERNTLASKMALYSAIVLIAVLFSGSYILHAFGIATPVVLIGGGLVIACLGWKMFTPSVSHDDANANLPITLAACSIVVAIALGAHSIARSWDVTLIKQIGNAIGISLACFTAYLCYTKLVIRTAAFAEIIIRVAAFINFCVGLQLIAHGMYYFFGGSSVA